MLNLFNLLSDALEERHKTISDLEKDGLLSKNTVYKYSKFDISLVSLIKFANYLEMSIDYLLGLTNDNKFKKYNLANPNFYLNLKEIMKVNNVSQYKLSKDLLFSDSNFGRWKNGTMPSLSKLLDLSNYLSCPIDDFIDKE